MDLPALLIRLHAIRDANAWRRYHNPKNLAMAASVEMAELVEIFQWKSDTEARALSTAEREHAGQEIADVLLYLLQLGSELELDVEQAVLAKLADNEGRFLP